MRERFHRPRQPAQIGRPQRLQGGQSRTCANADRHALLLQVAIFKKVPKSGATNPIIRSATSGP